LEYVKKLIFLPQHELGILGGFSLEGYAPPESDGNSEDKGINSGMLTFGFSYDFRFEPLGNSSIGVQSRYNIFVFDSGDVKGPQGDTITLALSFKYSANDVRRTILKELDYLF